MSERREVAVDFTCDRCCKSRAAARFVQRHGEPERVVTTPADWYGLRRGVESPKHFCSKECMRVWSSVLTIEAREGAADAGEARS
jgi:hypothetical protein